MSHRLRATPAAGAAALLLVLLITGFAAARTMLVDPRVATTAATFVDADGNGIDDACQQAVVADPAAAAAAEAAIDADRDGTISVPEAAHSDRTSGENCNHGGYVSSVAKATDAADESTTEETEASDTEAQDQTCVPVAPPVRDPALDGQKNAHGAWISTVAQSDATGGRNCNHGGAVSEASKADNAARKAARDAAKVAAKAARQHGKGHSSTH